jgi:hypothetical protein
MVLLALLVGACKTTSSSAVKDADGTPPSSVPYTIVSDIDDTVKITDVPDPLQALINGVFGRSVFSGMSELYTQLLTTQPPADGQYHRMIFLSGGPSQLASELRSTLVVDRGFPAADFLLKTHWPEPEIQAFKEGQLQVIAPKINGAFILLGDDTEKDPEALTDFAASAAGQGRVLAIYIHKVTGRALPGGVSSAFYTAFDVALAELAAGRLTADQAAAIGDVVLAAAQNTPASLFPSYAFCPEDLAYTAADSDSQELQNVKAALPPLVTAYCQAQDGGQHHDAVTKFLKFLEKHPT